MYPSQTHPCVSIAPLSLCSQVGVCGIARVPAHSPSEVNKWMAGAQKPVIGEALPPTRRIVSVPLVMVVNATDRPNHPFCFFRKVNYSVVVLNFAIVIFGAYTSG